MNCDRDLYLCIMVSGFEEEASVLLNSCYWGGGGGLTKMTSNLGGVGKIVKKKIQVKGVP